jgi:hypothetical protein
MIGKTIGHCEVNWQRVQGRDGPAYDTIAFMELI